MSPYVATEGEVIFGYLCNQDSVQFGAVSRRHLFFKLVSACFEGLRAKAKPTVNASTQSQVEMLSEIFPLGH